MKLQRTIRILICGLLSAAVDFCLIPTFVRGVPDFIWVTLMLLLPAIPAVVLLKQFKPSSVFWCALVQCLTVIVLAQPLGSMIGYHLGDIAHDLFDYIGFWLFAFGIIGGATLVQFLALWLAKIIPH